MGYLNHEHVMGSQSVIFCSLNRVTSLTDAQYIIYVSFFLTLADFTIFLWDLVMPAAVPSTHSWILHALYYKNSSRYSTTSMQTECIFWQVWLSPNLTKKRREWSHSYLDTMASFRIFYPKNSIHGYFTYISVLRAL